MISICFVYFRSVTLDHLDAAWFSLSRQDFSNVNGVYVLDNNTDDDQAAIRAVIDRYRLPVPVYIMHAKHRLRTRTHSWSVNKVVRWAAGPLIFFTRADYILDARAVERFAALVVPSKPRLITSYAYHMAFDERGDQRIEGFRDIEQHHWRERGAQVLLDAVNGWRVHSCDLDAGVWLLPRETVERVGGLDEGLVEWGYAQTLFQKHLRDHGVPAIQIPEYLFFHQHHAAPRSYDRARADLAKQGITVEELAAFRPDVATHTGSVCDELDEPDVARGTK
jgi:hypothetical protein